MMVRRKKKKEKCTHPYLSSCVWLFATPWTVGCQLLCPQDLPGKNPRAGHHFFSRGIFPAQGSNPHLLCLLYWQADSLPLNHLGSPASNLENYNLNFPQVIILHMQLESCHSKKTLETLFGLCMQIFIGPVRNCSNKTWQGVPRWHKVAFCT